LDIIKSSHRLESTQRAQIFAKFYGNLTSLILSIINIPIT